MNSIRVTFRYPLLFAAWLIVVSIGESRAQSPKSPASQAPPATGSAEAARFDSKEIKIEAAPGAAVVDLSYEFTNTGEIPLVVEEFSHSCGCMQGAWDGVPVEPGGRGKITAKFLTNGLRGTIRKLVRVKFVGSGSVDLIGEVRIPESLTYSAQTLRWVVGEEFRSQWVDVVIDPQSPLRVLSVNGNDPAFACELKTIEEARKNSSNIPVTTVMRRSTPTGSTTIKPSFPSPAPPKASLSPRFGIPLETASPPRVK